MKIKYLYLNLFTLLVMSYTNGADETARPEEGAKSGRSMLRASQMTVDADDNDLTENKDDEIKTTSTKVPSLGSTPSALPSPKEPSPKGRSPKVRYNHDSFSGPVAKGGAPKSSN